jgi:hypothetical protein
MTLDEIADLIASAEAKQISSGNYHNQRGIRGYFVQVKCGNHWCKVSVSHADKHSDRIRLEELNELDSSAVRPAVTIPVQSISSAIRSAANRDAPLHRYRNSSDIDGVWAEFHHNGNWYMVSVSHIDVPVFAKPAELERMADDLLWQQGAMKRNRRFG